MPAVHRYGDICTGHNTCEPRPNISASTDVYVNNRGAHRTGDSWAIHCKHSSVLATGSSTVFVNGRELGRIGDLVACGSLTATGSEDVFAGG
jgi:uncharacterized Zn-binding protein involved in type VI secretion